MGSRFLSSGATDLTALQDGTFDLNVSTAVLQSLTPSLPLHASATKGLISSLIQLTDCNFTPITNPAAVDLDMGGHAITDINDLLLTSNAAPTTPAIGMLTVYESGNKLRYKDSTTATYQVATSTDLAAYLPLAGGTMAGTITMGSNAISGSGAISGASLNTTGDATVAALRFQHPFSLAIGNGASTLNDQATAIGTLTNARGSSTILGANSADTGVNNVSIGSLCTISGNNNVSCGRSNTASGGNVLVFGTGLTNSTPNTMLIGCLGGLTNLRADGTTCDLGTVAVPFQTLYLNGSIAGPTNSRTVDNIVSNAGASTSGNLASLSGTTGKVITDSGVVAASVVVGPASAVSGNLPSYSGITGKLIADSGVVAASVVVGPASVVSGNLPSYSGTTGKLVADSGVVAASVVVGPASVVTGNVASYNGTTGKLVADSGVLASSIVLGPASVVSGNLPSYSGTTGKLIADSGVVAANVVTGPASVVSGDIPVYSGTTGKLLADSAAGIGTIGAITLANSTASTSTGSGAFICAGGAGIAGKAYIGSNTVIGPTQTIALENTLTLRGTVSSGTAGPHIATYVSGSQYPNWQQLGYANDNVWTSYDAYFDGVWKSSSANSNFGINKITNQLQFNYASGNVAGAGVTWTVAGGIDTSGILQWNKAIKTADTTVSSSKTTGSIVAAGGLGVSGAGNFGGKLTISAADSTIGFDLATANCFANMRVIQNTSATADKDLYIGYNSGATSSLHLYSNNSQCVYVDRGNTVVGAAVVAAATDGFLYIPTVPATKTGTPTAYTGTIPMVFDTSVNKLVVYTGGTWKSVGPFT